VNLDQLEQQAGGENLVLPVLMVKKEKEVSLDLLAIQDILVTMGKQDMRVRQVKMVSLVRLVTLENEVHLDQEELPDNLEHLERRVTVGHLGQTVQLAKEEIEENLVHLDFQVQLDLLDPQVVQVVREIKVKEALPVQRVTKGGRDSLDNWVL
jgi:hypothetical protein